MATDMKSGVCFRVPKSLRRRINRIGKLKLKSTSEMARDAFLEYAQRREAELNINQPTTKVAA